MSTYSTSLSASGGSKALNQILKVQDKRPQLPNSTPAPGLGGRPNPYATAFDHRPRKDETAVVVPTISSSDLTINANRIILEKIALKLPYDVRETVFSIVNSALASSDHALKQHEAAQMELYGLRSLIKKKTSELDILHKRIDNYRYKLGVNDEVVATLHEEDKHHNAQHDKSVKAMARLAKTNRVLIDAFEALSGSPSKRKSTAKRAQTSGSIDDVSRPTTRGSELHRTNSGVPSGALPAGGDDGFDPDDPFIGDMSEMLQSTEHSSNGKVRASLLRMARDYYKMVKNIDLLQIEIESLTSNLRSCEKRNRQLQLELEELKENNSISSQGSHGMGAAAPIRPDSPEESKKDRGPRRGVQQSLEDVDGKLAELLVKKAFDPLDGIKQMRLIVRHMSNSPSSLLQDDMIRHVCSAEVCKMFEVEAIVCFVIQPGGEVMRKYTSRASQYKNVTLGLQKSIAELVVRDGRMIKINSHKSKHHRQLELSVDGCDGVYSRKMLCVPLVDSTNLRVIGCMQLINKSQNFKFSEVDELFSVMFSDLAGTLIASALLFNRVWDRSETLTNILESSTGVLKAMPDSVAITSSFPLRPDQVLLAVQDTCQRALRCTKVKAFILSDTISAATGIDSGSLITLEDDLSDPGEKFLKRKQNKNELITTIPGLPGIAGDVIKKMKPYLMVDQSVDALHNPQVDLTIHSDNAKTPMYTVPIITLQGQILGCVQFLRGPSSPKLVSGPSSVLTGRVLFEAAAQWIGYQLSASLHHILQFVGRPCSYPQYLPQNLEPMQKINAKGLNLKPASGDKSLTEIDDVADIGSGDKLDSRLLSGDLIDEDDNVPVAASTSSAAAAQPQGGLAFNAGSGTGQQSANKSSSQKLPTVIETSTSTVAENNTNKESNAVDNSVIISLQEEVKNLKSMLGRMNTRDLNIVDHSHLVRDRTHSVSRDDSMRSMFSEFSQPDINVLVEVDGEKDKDHEENIQLRKDLDHLRSEFISLKELYEAKATGMTSLTAQEIAALEDKVRTSVTASLSKSHSADIEVKLAESKKAYEKAVTDKDRELSARLKENEDLKKTIEELRNKTADNESTIESLRVAMQALSSVLEAEREEHHDEITTLNVKLVRAEASSPRGSSSYQHSTKGSTSVKSPGSATKKTEMSPVEVEIQQTLNHVEQKATHISVKNKNSPESHPPFSAPHPIVDPESAKPSTAAINRAKSHESSRPPTHSESAVPASPRFENWARFIDESGFEYYHNFVTGVTSWDPPAEFHHNDSEPRGKRMGNISATENNNNEINDGDSSLYLIENQQDYPVQNEDSLELFDQHHFSDGSAIDPVRIGDWVQHYDEQSGASYWRNELTGESLWELPIELSESIHGSSHEEPPELYHSSAVSNVGKMSYGSASAGGYSIDL